MKEKTLFFILFIFNFYFSQEKTDTEVNVTTEKNISYHDYRIENSIPSYSLSKIEKMISKLESDHLKEGYKEMADDYYISISEKDFNKLTIKEKFTYSMIHPEYISQVCAEDIIILDEENKIFGNLPLTLDGASWSERQNAFFKQNRKEVLALIKESSLKNKRIGLNFKMTLQEINAVEVIPFLIDFYTTKDKKDKDILTLLMVLVKKSKYYPFARSNIYRILYADDKSYYESYVDYSEINEEYIIKTAHNLFLQSPKKK